jgi:CRISPR-associated protein Cmr5
MSLRSVEQERAGDAYAKVTEVQNSGENDAVKGKYKARTKDFPAMVLTNGLLQSLGFVLSKGGDPDYKKIGNHINGWVGHAVENGWLPRPPAGQGTGDLAATIRWLGATDARTYLAVTAEVLHYAPWLKRFAEGIISAETLED